MFSFVDIFGMKAALLLVSLIQVCAARVATYTGSSGDAILPITPINTGGGGVFPVDDSNFLGSLSKYNKKPDYGSPVQSTLSCESDSLHCVSKLDCEDNVLKGTRQCPPYWKKIGGTCYFIPARIRVRNRSQPEARQYCKDLGANLVWFENEYEKNAVKEEIGNNPFWTDGVYNKKKEIWYWENSWFEVVFKKLDGGVSNDNPKITDPRDQQLCLAVNKTGFNPDTCYDEKSFVCKMGNFDNWCEKSHGRCCWGPSYGYYYKNLHGSTLNTNLGSATIGSCYVKFDGEILKCEKAFEELKNLPIYRIGKSIYYLNSADEGCSRSREAVIANEDIHLTISRFLMTIEKLNKHVKIGLKSKATDTGSELFWVNGKSVDYYKNVYWATGYPKQILSGCVMYRGTSSDGSGPYLWMTVDDALCTDANHMVLCQLPIRDTDVQPGEKKKACGIRQSGGVMARSFSQGNDHEEARFGEWPWQAAIKNTRSYNLGVGQEFACSGVLLSHDVVLTSAHCIRGLSSGGLLVSLGDYDLEAVNQRKLLEPLVVNVKDVILHEDYARGKNDLAILQLSKSVSYLTHPHINVGCLPSQSILNAGGDWECMVTGWPQAQRSYHSSQRRLQRIEVDFVSRTKCQEQTRSQCNGQYLRKEEPELLCVEPWDSTTCLADATMMLVCKKTTVFNDDPFNLGEMDANICQNKACNDNTPSCIDWAARGLCQSSSYYMNENCKKSCNKCPNSGSNSYGSSADSVQGYTSKSTRVINAYGKNRFNAEKWYVIGVGHESNSCRQSVPVYGSQSYGHQPSTNYLVFTPVHEYLSFIHTLVDETEEEVI